MIMINWHQSPPTSAGIPSAHESLLTELAPQQCTPSNDPVGKLHVTELL
jgi:hypothetical protein